MEISKKINFKQMKYWLPLPVYGGLLLLGWLVIDMFNIELSDPADASLVSKDEYNSELPSAQIDAEIGDKVSNMRKKFGDIKDLTGISNVENDKDSLDKKVEYSTKYTEEELAQLKEKMRADSLQALLDARQAVGRNGRDQTGEEFRRPLSPDDRRKVDRLRSKGINVEELERDLGINFEGESLDRLTRNLGMDVDSSDVAVVDSVKTSYNRKVSKKVVEAVSEETDESAVVKRVNETSAHFNTISENVPESNVIRAIIDEEVKVVDGSRVRLRLLDDVEIDRLVVRKGSYLYAEMGSFSKQRIKGKISSIMSGDNIMKCNLNIYDMDGLEGLYVPRSAFRETVKDVGGNALSSGNMNISGSMDARTSVAQFATQALQNAYQRSAQAISKAIRKNTVRLKYGTQVFLINGNKKKTDLSSTPLNLTGSRSVAQQRPFVR